MKVRAGRLGVCAIAATGFVLGGLLATACSSATTDEGWVITSFQSDISSGFGGGGFSAGGGGGGGGGSW